jgi:hypothetical protein
MPITYSRPQSDAEIYADQAKVTRGQLQKLEREIKILRDEADRDPYYTVPRLKLPPLLQLRSELQARLMVQEGRTRVATSTGAQLGGDEHRALSSGSFFVGSDR